MNRAWVAAAALGLCLGACAEEAPSETECTISWDRIEPAPSQRLILERSGEALDLSLSDAVACDDPVVDWQIGPSDEQTFRDASGTTIRLSPCDPRWGTADPALSPVQARVSAGDGAHVGVVQWMVEITGSPDACLAP